MPVASPVVRTRPGVVFVYLKVPALRSVDDVDLRALRIKQLLNLVQNRCVQRLLLIILPSQAPGSAAEEKLLGKVIAAPADSSLCPFPWSALLAAAKDLSSCLVTVCSSIID